jgi:hypothetical protein
MSGVDNEDVRQFMERAASIGSKIVGALTGVALTAATSQPWLAAIVTPYVAVGLEQVGKDFLTRQLGPRQDVRVGAIITLAAFYINERIGVGDELRKDEFFDDIIDERSPAKEIIEAAIFTASQSFEEKKIPYVSKLTANICFDINIDLPTAHMLIGLANRLSFRGFVLLNIANKIDSYELKKRPEYGETPISALMEALSTEIFGLIQMGLVEMRESEESTTADAVLSAFDVEPNMMRLNLIGKLLAELMKLSDIEETDPTHIKTLCHLREVSLTASGRSTTVGGATYG